MTIASNQPSALDTDVVEGLARATLVDQGCPERAEMTVHLIDDERMSELNLAALGKQGPTDVLSFPLERLEAGRPFDSIELGPPLALGDVFIAPAEVERRARANGFDVAGEMALMVVHGTLHLLGHEHRIDSQAEEMEEIERRVLEQHGFSRR